MSRSARCFIVFSTPVLAMAFQPPPGLSARQRILVAETAASGTKPAELPVTAQAHISAVLGRDQPAYHAVRSAQGFRIENPRHALAADFTTAGVQVRAGRAGWKLTVRGLGYGDKLRTAPAVAPTASANRIEYRRGDFIEWYMNGPLGLEQGFTIAEPPGKHGAGPLTLVLSLSGDLTASVDSAPTGLILSNAGGSATLRYSGLIAQDATGRELRAWLDVEGQQLRLRVDDAGARYPLVVDPFIQQAKLTASDGAPHDQLGTSVAVDGDTIVIGAPGDDIGFNPDQGSAYVFVKPQGGWGAAPPQTAKLVASDAAPLDFFGTSVWLSGDTIVVAAPNDDIGSNPDAGSAYVFVRPAGGWSGTLTQSAKLTASDGAVQDFFGRSVAISGETVVVGVAGDDINGNDSQGSAYVFVKPAGGWSGNLTESAKLISSDGAAGDQFGDPAAIDGDTIVVATPGRTGITGINGQAYVFVKPAGGWTGTLTENSRLAASDGNAVMQFGRSLAVSGGTIVVGAPLDRIGMNDSQGSAYVFVRPGGGWSGSRPQDAKLIASDGAASDRLGAAVAITGDTVVVGANGDDTGGDAGREGSVYLFVKPAFGWLGTFTQNAKLTASDGAAGDSFGRSVAISGDTIIIAAPLDDTGSILNQGSAYVFAGDQADLSLSKTDSPDPVIAGSNVAYTITVTNNGPATANSVTLTDNLPPEVSFVNCNSTGGGTCGGSNNNRTVTFSSLASGSSETITIIATVNAGTAHGTIVSNTASVASATTDSVPGNDSSTITTTVIRRADLAVTKTASPASVETGTNVTYTISITNNGPNSADGVILTDTLPPNTTFLSNSGAAGWNCINPAVGGTGSISCTIGSLASGTTATFTVAAKLSCTVANGTVINNTAMASTTTPDPALANNSSTATVRAVNSPPTVSASVLASSLAPKLTHDLESVGLSATTSDGACPAPSVSSVHVFGDEDDETPTDRDEVFSPDAGDITIGTLRLRAERVNELDGRVYLIVVKATDSGGAVGFGTATVVVPKNPSPSFMSSVSAQAAAAKAFADANSGNPPSGYFVIGDGPLIGKKQ